MKKTSQIFLLSLALFLISSQATKAFETKSAENVSLKKEDVINGSLYAAGNTITIDGNIKGDLFCAAETLTINGKIDGDVVCAASTIIFNGQAEGSTRLAGQTINVNGQIRHNLQALAETTNLSEKATVGWEMFILSDNAKVDGTVSGDLHGALNSIIINGQIGKDVKLRLGNEKGINPPLVVSEKAKIQGNLFYVSKTPGDISPLAQVKGQVSYSPPNKNTNDNSFFTIAWKELIAIFSAFIIGLVLISLWREPIISITDNMTTNKGLAISAGAIVLFLTPIISVILIFTIIGLPLALIILCLWIIALYISKIICGILIGRLFLKKINKTESSSLIWAMISGITLLYVLMALPFIDWLVSLLAIIWGLGGLYFYIKKGITLNS